MSCRLTQSIPTPVTAGICLTAEEPIAVQSLLLDFSITRAAVLSLWIMIIPLYRLLEGHYFAWCSFTQILVRFGASRSGAMSNGSFCARAELVAGICLPTRLWTFEIEKFIATMRIKVDRLVILRECCIECRWSKRAVVWLLFVKLQPIGLCASADRRSSLQSSP